MKDELHAPILMNFSYFVHDRSNGMKRRQRCRNWFLRKGRLVAAISRCRKPHKLWFWRRWKAWRKSYNFREETFAKFCSESCQNKARRRRPGKLIKVATFIQSCNFRFLAKIGQGHDLGPRSRLWPVNLKKKIVFIYFLVRFLIRANYHFAPTNLGDIENVFCHFLRGGGLGLA